MDTALCGVYTPVVSKGARGVKACNPQNQVVAYVPKILQWRGFTTGGSKNCIKRGVETEGLGDGIYPVCSRDKAR